MLTKDTETVEFEINFEQLWIELHESSLDLHYFRHLSVINWKQDREIGIAIDFRDVPDNFEST